MSQIESSRSGENRPLALRLKRLNWSRTQIFLFEEDLERALRNLGQQIRRKTGRIFASYPRRVYIVDLDLPTPPGKRGHIYVGETGLTPEERFKRHRRGEQSSRYVREHGIRLRPDLYDLIPPVNTNAESLDAEKRVMALLENFGFVVKGH